MLPICRKLYGPILASGRPGPCTYSVISPAPPLHSGLQKDFWFGEFWCIHTLIIHAGGMNGIVCDSPLLYNDDREVWPWRRSSSATGAAGPRTFRRLHAVFLLGLSYGRYTGGTRPRVCSRHQSVLDPQSCCLPRDVIQDVSTLCLVNLICKCSSVNHHLSTCCQRTLAIIPGTSLLSHKGGIMESPEEDLGYCQPMLNNSYII